MTTPTRQQVYEKACEQYHNDNPHILTNPEEDELRESGYLFSAQAELMTSEARKNAEWFELAKPQLEKPQATEQPIPFV